MRQVCAIFFAAGLITATIGRADAVSIGRPAPPISGDSWINSPPLNANDLKGRVVLVEFWTYG